MLLELHPMLESDLLAFHSIVAACNRERNDESAVLYPNGYTAETLAWLAASDKKQMQLGPDKVKFWKIIDPALPADHAHGRMIAGAKWRIFPRGRTAQDFERDKERNSKRGFPPGCNIEFRKAFAVEMERCDREVVGHAPVMKLSMLFTHPDHQRRGAGGMLVRWGTGMADELGIQALVTASPIGRPLYESLGYKWVRAVNIDFEAWGHPNPLSYTCLVRPAERMNGVEAKSPTAVVDEIEADAAAES